MTQSAEQAVISRSPDGVSDHEMTSGWRVIVARKGERCATWYYHSNDDKRLPSALRIEAERRFTAWSYSA
jgi:hypothetical protein